MSKLFTEPNTGVKWNVNWRSRPKYPQSFSVSIDVSLNNKRCEGRYLECLLHLNRNFKRIEVSLGDTLQAKNYVRYGHPTLGKLSPERCSEVAMKEGDEWIVRNTPRIQRALQGVEFKLVRWSSWQNTPSITAQKLRLRNLLGRSVALQQAVKKDLNRFEKYWKLELSTDIDFLAADYILEELAVYMHQQTIDNYLHVYPGSKLNTLIELKKMEEAPTILTSTEHIYYYLR